MFVSLTEVGVFRYPHPEMEGWRLYRIEYGGVNQDCFHECSIWLPPELDSTVIEHLLSPSFERS